MTALEDWDEVRYDSLDIEATHSAADAAIAELLATIERLKCCATCVHYDSFGSAMFCRIECPERIHAYDHQRYYESRCQYDPSRWQSREKHVHEWTGPFKVGSQEWERRCACGATAPTHPSDANWRQSREEANDE